MDNKQLAEKYDLSAEHFWKQKQSGKWIITHKGCWKIAMAEGIVFSKPEIIIPELAQVVLYGTATLGENTVWTYGEAYPQNCHVPYFWAMAEKRLKDRLTLMLIGVYGEVYSEIEAEEFAAVNSQERKKPDKPYKANNGVEHGPPTDKQFNFFEDLLKESGFTDSQKDKLMEKAGDCISTWDMSGLIDYVKQMKRDE